MGNIKKFIYDQNGSVFEYIVIFAMVAALVLLIFLPYRKNVQCWYTHATGSISTSIQGASMNGQCSSTTTLAAGAGGGSNGGSPSSKSTNPGTSGTSGTSSTTSWSPTAYKISYQYNPKCTPENFKQSFTIPSNAVSPAVGIETLKIKNTTGFDQFIKINQIKTTNNLTITQYPTQYLVFPSNNETSINIPWSWDNNNTGLGGAEVNLSTSCTAPTGPILYQVGTLNVYNGKTITLSGINLGISKGNGYIQIRQTQPNGGVVSWGAPGNWYLIPITAWSNTSLTFEIPNHQTSSNDRYTPLQVGLPTTLQVFTNSGQSTAPLELSVGNPPTPTLQSVSPSNTYDGGIVTLTGTDFGSTQGNGYVWIQQGNVNWGAPGNWYRIPILSWSNTAVTIEIPNHQTSPNDSYTPLQPNVPTTVAIANTYNGLSKSVPIVIAAAPSSLPATPTNFKVVGTTQSSISVQWSPVSGATNYLLTVIDEQNNHMNTISTNNSSEIISGLTSGTSYEIFLAAGNASGINPKTTQVSASTTGTSILPQTPTHFYVSSTTNNSLTLVWTPASGDQSYTVQDQNGNVIYQGNGTTYTQNGLLSGTSYSYELQSSNTKGTSTWAKTSGTTSGQSPLPQTNFNFQVSNITSASMKLSWSLPTNATSVVITNSNNQVIYSGSNTSDAVTNLTPNTTYSFSIQGKNSYGYGNSSSVSATTLSSNTLAVGPNVSASNVTSTSATISWTAVPGATYYILKQDGNLIYQGSALTFTPNNLTPGIPYTFSVTGSDGNGTTPTNSVTVTTFLYSGTTSLNTPCEAYTISENFNLPQTIYPGDAGVVEIKPVNTTTNNMLLQIQSAQGAGVDFTSTNPIQLSYSSSPYSFNAGQTDKIPVTWSNPAKGQTYKNQNPTISVVLNAICN